MTSGSIFVFALALIAFVGGAAWWTIWLTRRLSDVRSWISTLQSDWSKRYVTSARKIEEISSKLPALEASAPAALAARVDELAEALERLRMTHQRFAGRVSQFMGHDPRPDNSPPTLDREELKRAHAASIMPPGIRK